MGEASCSFSQQPPLHPPATKILPRKPITLVLHPVGPDCPIPLLHLLWGFPTALHTIGQSLTPEHCHWTPSATSSLPIGSSSIQCYLFAHFTCGIPSCGSPVSRAHWPVLLPRASPLVHLCHLGLPMGSPSIQWCNLAHVLTETCSDISQSPCAALASPCCWGIPIGPSLQSRPSYWLILDPVALFNHFLHGICSSSSQFPHGPLANPCHWNIAIGPSLPPQPPHWFILDPVGPFDIRFAVSKLPCTPLATPFLWGIPIGPSLWTAACPLVHPQSGDACGPISFVAFPPEAPHYPVPHWPVPVLAASPLVHLCNQQPPHWLILNPVATVRPFPAWYLLQWLPITLHRIGQFLLP